MLSDVIYSKKNLTLFFRLIIVAITRMSQEYRRVKIVSDVRAENVEDPRTQNRCLQLLNHIEEHDAYQNEVEATCSTVSDFQLLFNPFTLLKFVFSGRTCRRGDVQQEGGSAPSSFTNSTTFSKASNDDNELILYH